MILPAEMMGEPLGGRPFQPGDLVTYAGLVWEVALVATFPGGNQIMGLKASPTGGIAYYAKAASVELLKPVDDTPAT